MYFVIPNWNLLNMLLAMNAHWYQPLCFPCVCVCFIVFVYFCQDECTKQVWNQNEDWVHRLPWSHVISSNVIKQNKSNISRGARTTALVVGPRIVLITEAAINTVFFTTPLVLCAVQLFAGVWLSCRKKVGKERDNDKWDRAGNREKNIVPVIS